MLNNFTSKNYHSRKRAKSKHRQGYKSEQSFFLQILLKIIIKNVVQKEARMDIHKNVTML